MSDRPRIMVFPMNRDEIIHFDRIYVVNLGGIIRGQKEGLLRLQVRQLLIEMPSFSLIVRSVG